MARVQRRAAGTMLCLHGPTSLVGHESSGGRVAYSQGYPDDPTSSLTVVRSSAAAKNAAATMSLRFAGSGHASICYLASVSLSYVCCHV